MALQMARVPFARLQEVLFSQKVNGLLAEVQADWEDRRCFLPSKPLAGTTGFILNLQPNQQKGLFLPIDDVSSRNRFLT